MKTFCTVTGPTIGQMDRKLDGTPYEVKSFEDRLNAKMRDLAAKGVDPAAITVEWSPMGQGFHAALLSWEDVEAPTLTIAEVAKLTGIPRGTVYDMVARGELPRVETEARIVRIPAKHPAVARLLGAV